MTTSEVSMVVPKDQWWSLGMMSPRPIAARSALLVGGAPRNTFVLARNALYSGVKALGIKQGKRVLIPSYICLAAIDPFLAHGLEPDFYKVNRDCTPDFADIERKLTAATEALLIVHYFGFPAGIDGIRDLCRKRGIALIEDCAHVLTGQYGGKALGTFGDIAVFSWRKFLPVYDGAELVLNRPARIERADSRGSALFTLKGAVNLIEASISHSQGIAARAAQRLFHAGEAAFRRRATSVQTAAARLPESASLSFDVSTADWEMSRLSKWILGHSNVNKIVAARRRNYEQLSSELSGVRGVRPLMPVLPAAVCPWIFPVIFENLPHAHFLLRRRGIPAVAWDGVRHRRIPPQMFEDADFLYDNLVFLPIHQCLRPHQITEVAAAVKDLLSN
jgi:perosamine synthetase